MTKTKELSLFSELYTCYYHVVACILEEAGAHPVTRKRMEALAGELGYGESALSIVPRLTEGVWPFLTQDEGKPGFYRSVLTNPIFPMALTALQRSWLKALTADPRFCLFFTDQELKDLEACLEDVKPLYRAEDFCLFDQYGDHDPFSSVMYREHMHTLLSAMGAHQPLSISYLSGRGNVISHTWLPCRLEYGQRDGKFRLHALAWRKNGRQRMDLINVARILSLKKQGDPLPGPVDVEYFLDKEMCREPLVLEITTERNGLERALLHFSCYEKQVERIEETGTYRCTIYYDMRWETELLIQVLSFGPVVKVLGPPSFVQQVRERVQNQAKLRAASAADPTRADYTR